MCKKACIYNVHVYMYMYIVYAAYAPRLRSCNVCLPMAYLTVSHTHPKASNKPIKTLVVGQQQTNTSTAVDYNVQCRANICLHVSFHFISLLLTSLPPNQGNLRDHYVSELVLGQVPIDRVKLLVCGAAGVGKTELINSLKCNVLHSLFRRRSSSNFQQMILKRTHGMAVQHAVIPNAGSFSVWDFSGMKEFYVSHEIFLGGTNSIFILVLSLRDPINKQLAQMRFWLAMIKAKSNADSFSTKVLNRPFVILVGSFVDQQLPNNNVNLHSSDIFAVPLASTVQQSLDNGKSVLQTLAKEFGDYFDFSNTVYTMDCRLSQSYEMRSLRMLLGSLHSRVVKASNEATLLIEL